MSRERIKECKRWVVKVGSALLTEGDADLNIAFINNLAEQIAFLSKQGIEVLLVSSGSVAAGVNQLGMDKRPDTISELQAAAAVGQASLIRQYEQAFKPYAMTLAQILLTHADIANRERYLNARSALTTLIDLGVLTVINENDTVATDEICFGDNDNLAALVVNLVDADLLVILTDQDGLFTTDPRTDADAELLSEVSANDDSLIAMASGGSTVGRGGMVTKLTAAQTASRSGADTIIANGGEANIIQHLYKGENFGTLLKADERLASRKQWMAGQLKICGKITIDQGAVQVLKESGKSLLPVGISKTEGSFKRGELVSCVDQSGNEIARGLSNYNADEAKKIVGQASDQIIEILGYGSNTEFIHRDNLVLV